MFTLFSIYFNNIYVKIIIGGKMKKSIIFIILGLFVFSIFLNVMIQVVGVGVALVLDQIMEVLIQVVLVEKVL